MVKMICSSTHYTLLLLFLLSTTIAFAYPSRHARLENHLVRRRAAHGAHRHVESDRPPLASTNKDLLERYAAKLALRNTALETLRSSPSLEDDRRGRRGVPWREFSDEQLEEQINALEVALQSLINLLSADLGITVNTTTTTTTTTSSDTPVGISTPISTPPPGPPPAATIIEPVSSNTSTAPQLPPGGTTSSSLSSTPVPSPSQPPGGPYVFDPMASDNVAVYYGQTTASSAVSLTQVCSDPAVDVVILAFITTLLGPGGWPSLNMASHCWAPSSAQTQAGATGLIDCVGDGFAGQVLQCQGMGKKVLLSVGGAQGYSDTAMPSDDAAVEIATTIWNLFLGGTDNSTTNAIRPYGGVVLDGIDIDNESGNSAHFLPLIGSLRAIFQQNNGSKPYYLSAAPQCPRYDASIPLTAMQTLIDFTWVQFYNNPPCNLNSGAGFLSSLSAWSGDLTANDTGFVNIGNGVTSPRLYIGAPDFAAAGSGFVDEQTFRGILGSVVGLIGNLGGVMFWDGAFGEESGSASGGPGNETYMQIVKDVLG